MVIVAIMDTPNLFSGLSSEWSTLSRSPQARAAAARWAGVEEALAGYATPGEIVRRCQVRGDQAGSNAVLAAVLRQARGDAVAVRTVLMAVLPGLAALSARRHHLVGGELGAWTDIDQLDQDIVAAALDKITAMAGEDCDWVASIVVGAVRDILRRAERRHRRDRAMTLPLSAAAGRIAAPDLDTVEAYASVLVDAARSGLLAHDRAALLYAIRVLGHTPRELAVASGRDVRAVRVQRARAERTLARRLATVS